MPYINIEDQIVPVPIKSSGGVFDKYPIGRLCITKKPSAIFDAGQLGIVLEHYDIGHQGVGIFFPTNQSWDGFSKEDLELFIENTNFSFDLLRKYLFTNVVSLYRDLENLYKLVQSNEPKILQVIKKKEAALLAKKIGQAIKISKKDKKNKI